ncbi:MAG: hypothetical protein ACI8WB_000508, partial [Phenylobacterium sp.]
VKVHYLKQYQGAYWHNSTVYIGDGADDLYPLTSADLLGHEIAHGLTQQYSRLVYNQQSGGINEAFSDISGEAVEFKVNGSNDWLIGGQLTKTTQAVRYFADPTLNGKSIDHFADYDDLMNVHDSSGIFNKAFYLLANTPDWGFRRAYDVMVDANKNYWTSNSSFAAAACGVIASALDRQYPALPVDRAFLAVGVSCDNLPALDLDNNDISDFWQDRYGFAFDDTDMPLADADNDGLNNLAEFQAGTDPTNTDTDGDTLSDFDEINLYQTNPVNTDSDGDRLPDNWELEHHLNPVDSSDQFSDHDGDGFNHFEEYISHSDPTNAASMPVPLTAYAESFEAGLAHGWFNRTNNDPGFTVIKGSVTDGNTSDGLYSLRSDTISIDKGVQIQWSAMFSAGYLTFDMNGYSLHNTTFTLLVDGQVALTMAPPPSRWTSHAVWLDEGFHTLEWVLTTTYSHYLTRLWIDDLVFGLTDSSDTDGDLMPDIWEVNHQLDFKDPADALLDRDNDGLTNLQEYQQGSDLDDVDSDNDALPDFWEFEYGFDLLVANDATQDTDNDGFTDMQEYLAQTNPIDSALWPQQISQLQLSFEQQQLPQGWRQIIGDHPSNEHRFDKNWQVTSEQASDGLYSLHGSEVQAQWSGLFAEGYLLLDMNHYHGDYFSHFNVHVDGTQVMSMPGYHWTTRSIAIPAGFHTIRFFHQSFPANEDSDTPGHAWLDNIRFGDFATLDSDGDGITDVWEYNNNLNVNDPADASLDTDNDGLSHLQEFQAGTDINNADTDDDGIPDGWEVANQLNPTDASDVNADLDNDGFDNLSEYLTGSDPADAQDIPITHQQWTESFEANTLQPGWLPELEFRDRWQFTSTTSSEGLASLQATVSPYYSGDPSMTWSAYFEANYLLFDFKFSDEVGSEAVTLSLFVDGQHVMSIDNTDNQWQTKGIWLSEGRHSIRWYLFKRNHVQDDSYFWLDNVRFAIATDLDSDGDLMPDVWEVTNNLDINDPADALLDPDNDGLTNQAEYHNGTDILHPDSDGDKMPDGWEVSYELNPTHKDNIDADSDGDGFSNLQEYQIDNDPSDASSFPPTLSEFNQSFEAGTLPKGWRQEARAFAQPGWQVGEGFATEGEKSFQAVKESSGWDSYIDQSVMVTSGYLLFDALIPDETSYGLRVYLDGNYIFSLQGNNDWQTKAVFLSEGFHTLTWSHSIPYRGDNEPLAIDNLRFGVSTELDSDGDSMPDVWEIINQLDYQDPLDAALDPDYDGLTNAQEYHHGTYILSGDSDHDGMLDSWEVNHGFDPLSSADAIIDTDGDGYNNQVEYQVDTNPSDPNDYPPTLSEFRLSFEDGQLPQGWLSDIDHKMGWHISDSLSSHGNFALGSLSTTYYQGARITWSGFFAPGYLVFDYQLSNKELHGFALWIDGKPVMSTTSAEGWTTFGTILTAGFHQIRWHSQSYSGVGSDINGVNIDNIRFGQANLVDSDGDAMADFWEDLFGLDRTNPLDSDDDIDSDGLSNIEEYQAGTNPNLADTDDDQMTDGWEVRHGLNPRNEADRSQDADNDRLNNYIEFFYGTDPNNHDSDGDGLNDFWEVVIHLTNPLKADTDDDGVNDGQDFFPLDALESVDTDGDGIGNNADPDDDNDGVNDIADPFPLNGSESVDTDGDGIGNNADLDDDNDGYSDVDELSLGSNPINAASVPGSLGGWLPLLLNASGSGQ